MIRAAVWLAVLGALLLAAGAGLVFLPAALLVAGVEAIAGAYVLAYLSARRGRR